MKVLIRYLLHPLAFYDKGVLPNGDVPYVGMRTSFLHASMGFSLTL